ncbi:unnamed protein product [Caenorhabditis bovis]|uniref:Uncharacterized protein n=1 Tax=Caenorhabditis bovis TaxID=2654633 RepID=A0A8S1E6D7_9PELO|nr:unnamed protein product [Caenorhabditis bovis]
MPRYVMTKCSSDGATRLYTDRPNLRTSSRSLSAEARRRRTRLTRARCVNSDSKKSEESNTLSSSLSTIPITGGNSSPGQSRVLVKGHTVSSCTPRFG